MHRIQTFLVHCVLAATCVGCHPVDDFGDLWNEGDQDPALLGHWNLQKGFIVSQFEATPYDITSQPFNFPQLYFSPTNRGYLVRSAMTMGIASQTNLICERACRTITLNGHHFLLLAAPKPAKATLTSLLIPYGGMIINYRTMDDTVEFRTLPPDTIKTAIKDGTIRGTLPEEKDGVLDLTPPRLTALDQATQEFLIQQATSTNFYMIYRYRHNTEANKTLDDTSQ